MHFLIKDHLLRWDQLSDLCHSLGWLKVPWLPYYKEQITDSHARRDSIIQGGTLEFNIVATSPSDNDSAPTCMVLEMYWSLNLNQYPMLPPPPPAVYRCKSYILMLLDEKGRNRGQRNHTWRSGCIPNVKNCSWGIIILLLYCSLFRRWPTLTDFKLCFCLDCQHVISLTLSNLSLPFSSLSTTSRE